jgi:hypothetical protein
MIAAALLTVQAAAEPPSVRVPMKPTTAASMTRAAFDLDCTLVDASMKHYALSIEQRGGRGYFGPASNDPVKRLRTTGLNFRVVRDETGLFDGRRLTGSDAGGLEIEAENLALHGVRLRTFSTGEGWDVEAIVYVGAAGPRYSGFVRYSGFCKATRHEQLPLTEAEIAEIAVQ